MAIGSIPAWLKNYLKSEDLALISEAVQKAEQTTSGEIVPMVVERSSTIRSVRWKMAMVLFSSLLILDVHHHWESLHEWAILITPFLAILCYSAGLFLSRFWFVQRLLTPNLDEIHQVSVRAELEFHRLNMTTTKERTGILIFVSMMERRVVILADEGISKKLPPETWQKLVDVLLTSLSQKKLKDGLIQAISSCGELLSQKLPSSAQDTNEIANDLIIKA